jgi:tetratricopeptide (TPR) repeat protein
MWPLVLSILLLTLASLSTFQSGSPQTGDGYVGGAVCASCHGDIDKSFKSVSMSQTFAPQSEVTPIEDWTSQNRFYHKPSNQHFVMSQRDGRFYQRRYQLDSQGREANSFEQEIHFAIGSGKKERDYLHRTATGELLQLPVVWYTQEKTWGMAPGYDRPDHDNFSRKVVYRCVFCHNAYPKLQPGADRYESKQSLFPAELPKGIDCERCHGPGGRHSREATASSIVNPAKLDRKLQMDVCMQCHLETTSQPLPNSLVKLGRPTFSYRPGEPLEGYVAVFDFADPRRGDAFNIVHQAYRLRQSPCFQASSMTCTTCHDPHRRSENPAEAIRAKCIECHVAVKTHGDDCVGCHMPQRRTDDVVHVVMTDHRIQKRPPPDLLKMKQEPIHEPSRGDLKFYLPEPQESLYMGIALARGGDVARGIALLEKQQPVPYFEIASAYAAAGMHGKAVIAYRAGLSADPDHAEGWYNLGLSQFALNNLKDARTAFDGTLKRSPSIADAWVGIGLIDLREGRPDTARRAYLEAIRVDPMNVTALLNLSTLERQSGNTDLARHYLQEANRIRPPVPR